MTCVRRLDHLGTGARAWGLTYESADAFRVRPVGMRDRGSNLQFCRWGDRGLFVLCPTVAICSRNSKHGVVGAYYICLLSIRYGIQEYRVGDVAVCLASWALAINALDSRTDSSCQLCGSDYYLL